MESQTRYTGKRERNKRERKERERNDPIKDRRKGGVVGRIRKGRKT
jgi:hypothetical protein